MHKLEVKNNTAYLQLKRFNVNHRFDTLSALSFIYFKTPRIRYKSHEPFGEAFRLYDSYFERVFAVGDNEY